VPEWAGVSRWAGFALLLILSGCGGVGALSLLTGGGPNVAANVQAGKTNTQTLGQTVISEQKLVNPTAAKITQSSGDSRVIADQVQTVVVNEVPPWVVLVALLGWLLPSPGEMGRGIGSLFAKSPSNRTHSFKATNRSP
jgi:phage-related minor tail protein